MSQYGRYTNKSSFTQKRKELRGIIQTEAEQRFWKRIKAKQLGVKFRRQHNIDSYIVDFYCHALKFIIELDWWVHGEEDQKKKDNVRQHWLESKGYIVKRYRNEQIKYELDAVLQDVWNTITTLKRANDPT